MIISSQFHRLVTLQLNGISLVPLVGDTAITPFAETHLAGGYFFALYPQRA